MKSYRHYEKTFASAAGGGLWVGLQALGLLILVIVLLLHSRSDGRLACHQ